MRIGLIGYGSIGRELHARLRGSRAFSFAALTRSALPDIPPDLTRVDRLEALLAIRPGLVVECAGHDALRAHGAAVLAAGVPLMVASQGALADPETEAALRAAARSPGARMILPAGAIGGLDLLRALADSGPVDVTYRGVKPPHAWKGTPAGDRADLDALTAPCTFFTGSGRDAARAFPRNANVVAALALAGAGFDRMRVELVADPAADGNTHAYTVASAACRYEMEIGNAPSPGNARTSLTTVLSLVSEIGTLAET